MADRQSGRAATGWLWITAGLTAGSLVAVVALAPPAGAAPVTALSWLLFTGSSVHVASTGALFVSPTARVYARQHRTRCLWVPAGLIVATASAAAIATPASFQWLLLPFFGWQFYHYQKQNLGVAALAAATSRVPSLSQAERQALLAAGLATIAQLAARPTLLGLRISLPLAWLSPAAATAFLIAVLAGIACLVRRPAGARPTGFVSCYLMALLFGLPAFVFASPYAAIGGMTLAHGLQYLVLVGCAAGGRGDPGRLSRPFRLAVLGNVALIGGALLSTASHLHNAGPAGRLVFGCYLGVVMAHFVIDAGIWRLRDPLARKFVTTELPFLVPAPTRPDRPALVSEPPGPPVSAVSDRSSSDIECAS